MDYNVITSPKAEVDIEQAVEWYVDIRVIPRDGSFAYPDDYEDPDHQHDYSLQRVEPKKPNLNELYK